jgi:hypothetical protein
MYCLWMKKPSDIRCRSDRMGRRPFELEDQHHVISHRAGPTQDGFNGGIDRLHDAGADGDARSTRCSDPPSSLAVSTSREDTIQFRMAGGIALSSFTLATTTAPLPS